MESAFTLDNFVTLGMLIMLQAVLGFDNLLYISLESKRAPEDRQNFVRKIGIGLAIFLRIGLLYLLVSLIGKFQKSIFEIQTNFLDGKFNVHSLIVLAGGVFIIYTSMKEIWHMMALENEPGKQKKQASTTSIIIMIVLMNLVFSFDSILSAIALTDVFWVMAVAIVIGGLLMIWLSEKISEFLKKNRMYEVLGLFILFVVGIMLISEGGHLAHMHFLGNEITPMSKTTFYFIISIMVIIDLVQGRYQKKIMTDNKELSTDTQG